MIQKKWIEYYFFKHFECYLNNYIIYKIYNANSRDDDKVKKKYNENISMNNKSKYEV